MSWSQAKLRKWHRDNPGKSRYASAVSRAFRRNRRAMTENLTRANPLLERLTYKGHRVEYAIILEARQ